MIHTRPHKKNKHLQIFTNNLQSRQVAKFNLIDCCHWKLLNHHDNCNLSNLQDVHEQSITLFQKSRLDHYKPAMPLQITSCSLNFQITRFTEVQKFEEYGKIFHENAGILPTCLQTMSKFNKNDSI